MRNEYWIQGDLIRKESKLDIHIINLDNVRILYTYACDEYDTAIKVARIADDSSTRTDEENARKAGVVAGIVVMADAYIKVHEAITSNYINMPSAAEGALREEYRKQDDDKNLMIALKVSPLIGSSKATYKVNIDTLLKHYSSISTSLESIIKLLKEQKENLGSM